MILIGHNIATLEQDTHGALKDLLTHLRFGVTSFGRRVIAHLKHSALRLEQIIQTLCRSGHSIVTLAAKREVDAVVFGYAADESLHTIAHADALENLILVDHSPMA